MGNTTRTVGRLLLILFLIAAVVATLGVILVRRSFPQLEGEISVAGLRRPVEVLRDVRGVPHIYAENEHDLFFAQGYVHAQDRFWQMDFWRHVGAGRLAELLGSDQLDADRFIRTVGWERLAEEEWEQASEDSKAILEAYAEGVNAYLTEKEGARLSFEYAILKPQNWGYQPAPWTPVNTLTWGKVIAWELRWNLDLEIERAMLAADLTEAELEALYPPYPEDHPITVGGSGIEGPTAAGSSLTEIGPLLSRVSSRAAALDALLGSGGSHLGSNNWAVSGAMTASGEALLANDPHLPVQMPSIWYEVGLHCTTVGLACGFETTGFSFAGVPGVIVGHNGQIAWGVTSAEHDVTDLFVEKVNPDNPDQYEFEGEWRDMDVTTELLEAPGQDPIELVVRSTHHGPIITDVFEPIEDFDTKSGIRVPEHYAISLSWTALQPGTTVETFFLLNQARSWADFRAALSNLVSPGQNFVYADREGNIGFQSTGVVPIRNAGNGTVPVPGWTGEFEWTGTVPFDDLPRSFNPAEGYVLTANNRPAGSDYPYMLSDMWDHGYRAQRILDMLEGATEPIDANYARLMQADSKDLFAQVLVPYLLELVPESDLARAGQALLGEWSRSGGGVFDPAFQMEAESPAAAVYAAVWGKILSLGVGDEIGGEFAPEGGSRWFEVIEPMLEDPDHPWWDNRFTEEIETRDLILAQALTEGMEDLSGRLGGNPESWQWGAVHTAEFENQSLGQSGIAPIEWLFNRGSYPTGGSISVPNATAWDAAEGYQLVAHPSMRMVIDFADLDSSTWIHSTGQSGHAYHPNYVDLAEDWAAVMTNPMPWTREAVEALTAHRLMLVPDL